MLKRNFFLVFSVLLPLIHLFANPIDTLQVFSEAMEKEVPNLVILPNTYENSKANLPVLYLLHGAGDQYTTWLDKAPELQAYADTYQMIIVCPDGGGTSWYLDSPIDETMRYETYLSKELIRAVDERYRSLAERSGRAITGLSMGGHGAFFLAFRHPDIWGATGSMSGGVDIRPFPNGWDLPKRLGSQERYPEHWEQHTVINQLASLQDHHLEILFDCGLDDFFLEVNRALHKALVSEGIPHAYTERPGSHNWEYWTQHIEYQLWFFHRFFQSKTR
jgi:S-formylglutathione hydrolase FrmB